MTALDPNATTVGDICSAALRECGAWGVGQTPLAGDINDAWMRFQWMLQQWERQRWAVYHLVELSKVSTGAYTYTVGPGGDFDTGVNSARPDRLEAARLRQIQFSQPNQVDYPMEVLQSREDYNEIALKRLMSFPGMVFLDTAWPLGILYTYPVPQPTIYEIFLVVREQLPNNFIASRGLATILSLPYEYYQAILKNLALLLRPQYGIRSGPGDLLPAQAKASLAVMKVTNAQIARLKIPSDLVRPGIWNIFSDRSY